MKAHVIQIQRLSSIKCRHSLQFNKLQDPRIKVKLASNKYGGRTATITSSSRVSVSQCLGSRTSIRRLISTAKCNSSSQVIFFNTDLFFQVKELFQPASSVEGLSAPSNILLSTNSKTEDKFLFGMDRVRSVAKEWMERMQKTKEILSVWGAGKSSKSLTLKYKLPYAIAELTDTDMPCLYMNVDSMLTLHAQSKPEERWKQFYDELVSVATQEGLNVPTVDASKVRDWYIQVRNTLLTFPRCLLCVDDHHLLLVGFETSGRTKMANEIKQLFIVMVAVGSSSLMGFWASYTKQHTDTTFCTDFQSKKEDLLDTCILLKKFKGISQSDLDKLIELLPMQTSAHLVQAANYLDINSASPEKYETAIDKMLKQVFKSYKRDWKLYEPKIVKKLLTTYGVPESMLNLVRPPLRPFYETHRGKMYFSEKFLEAVIALQLNSDGTLKTDPFESLIVLDVPWLRVMRNSWLSTLTQNNIKVDEKEFNEKIESKVGSPHPQLIEELKRQLSLTLNNNSKKFESKNPLKDGTNWYKVVLCMRELLGNRKESAIPNMAWIERVMREHDKTSEGLLNLLKDTWMACIKGNSFSSEEDEGKGTKKRK